jgi:hypothetical protein
MGIGFLVMAFDKNNDAQPIGTFQLPSDGKLMNCTADALVSDIHPTEPNEIINLNICQK